MYKLLRRFIRSGYRTLSLLNTISILMSGNPRRISKHLLRKSLYRRLGKWTR